MKRLFSGNEAVARGAFEAGVQVAAAYPGTPSTEILENIAQYPQIYAEWSVNEKVAFEVAYGAAVAGKRALAAMKHVGVNVASDALMTAAYAGVNAGMVLVSADDPGMHSSQNEQDNRYFARFAQIPMLEPSSSAEAKAFAKLAFEISEAFDTPIMLRMTTRICHGRGVVELEEPQPVRTRPYVKDPQKYVMMPANARVRRTVLLERMRRLAEYSETTPLNRVEEGDAEIGIITAGVSYTYAREVFPNASFLKLGMTNPLPMRKIAEFISRHRQVYVIEELEPFMEEQIKAAGLNVRGTDLQSTAGELSPDVLRRRFFGTVPKKAAGNDLPARPPVMCAGCPHRAVFSVLRKHRAVVSSDIGCYTLGALQPLNAIDSVLCMGASIGMAQGYARVLEPDRPVVAVLGDSTFIHAGIPALVNAVYNRVKMTVVILDNRITAMTGHQENPASGKTLQGEQVPVFDFEAVARAVGAAYVRTVDPIETEALERAIGEAIACDGVSVIIASRPCALVDRHQYTGVMMIDKDTCSECRLCLRIGCPAMSLRDGSVVINPDLCFGCSLCSQICPKESIHRTRVNVEG
ncbi:MAG: indolepyruvate ferredoxin oxidoreductase subunit alpha [candidate division KSB1 bacterium]|nr:indolepyruvate ferredoxin oxidoreductase subunit alpha [candidate division KSB1 bacterium]